MAEPQPFSPDDHRWMALALSLGRRGMGRVWPNPSVGCVIVHNNRVVGRGTTSPDRHAEPQALEQAGPAARGATAYVTLEPCCHHGRTPPCSDALIAAGVARVVTALRDPNPKVNGGGFAALQAAGISVQDGLLADQARLDHRGFLSVITQSRPFVTLKLATSFDGRIATATGQSKWITGPAARRLVHHERAQHDAVLVGGGTVRADDPRLTVRGLGIAHQPVRVVMSRRLDLPPQGKLVETLDQAPLWLCHGPDAAPDRVKHWQDLGAQLFECPLEGRQLSCLSVLQTLANAGLTRVFCEGGGALAASLLAGGMIDELVGFSAGIALGAEGQPAISALGISQMADAPRFDLVETRAVGGDVLHRWRPSMAV